jgi:SAM-dependent methyltransferase
MGQATDNPGRWDARHSDDPGRWDHRYDAPGYLFGTDPAAFVRAHVGLLAPGSHVLAVADGEGRNSVFLAEHGMEVTAFDGSAVAVAKARSLAQERGVDVDFHVSGVDAWEWTPGRFDAVAAVFIQFAAPAARARLFDAMIATLAPGGRLLLHGYTPAQIAYGTGGPPDAENMYTVALLAEAFAGHEIVELVEYEADLDEGPAHRGRSALIDCVVRRR